MSRIKIISDYYISENQKIIDVVKVFQSNRCSFAIVINNKKKFLGIITSSEIRKATLGGFKKNSSIRKIYNRKPLFFKGYPIDNEVSNMIIDDRFDSIDPPLIPLVNDKGIVFDIIHKRDVYNYSIPDLRKNISSNKVLVIGGAGYIGSLLINNLLKKGFEVTVYDKFIYNDIQFFKKKYIKKKLKIVKGDTQNISKIFKALKENDTVVHLAELVGDPLCEKRPEKTYTINFLATSLIGNICKNLGIKKFIYVSSCSVYGASKKLSKENSKINPLSIYAKIKTLCEKNFIRNLGEGNRPCILRLGTVYGLSDRPRYDLVVNLFSGLAANNKEITISGGSQWRPFIHVSDVCNAIINIIKDKEKNFNGQIINLVSENIQIKKIGNIIKKLYPKTKIKFDDNVTDKRDYKVSNIKAKKIINFKPQINITSGIKEIFNYTKKNKIKNIFKKKYINILNYKKF